MLHVIVVVLEVGQNLWNWPEVEHLPVTQKEQLVEEVENLRRRLMDTNYNSLLFFDCVLLEQLNQTQRRARVQR